MRTLGVITARGGSKRIPRKNTKLLGGKPLLWWTLEAAIKSTLISRLVVSSDDDEILELAARYDSRLPLQRPAELATDEATSLSVVRHALETLESAGEPRFSATLTLQPCGPFILASDIDAVLTMLEQSGADSVVTVAPLRQMHPAKFKRLDEDSRLLPYFEDDRQMMSHLQLPKAYARNGSAYATRRQVVDDGALIGNDCRAVVMPRERSIDIDDPIDWDYAEFLVLRHGYAPPAGPAL